ncbi:probable endo-1,3(4)-beta-glucanase ARB_01444 [Macadamia integrifolia]|uniref:probable endo-1,3(4)-beta-glucanase ARB_01444 n=1 Tax=Macadamia integrifolia TaxID=60698 RepID=UPI001C52A623|nr:probable endo-1,3(4)-beta-glucanase ARB_01444 [Macadamia integrifolia]
MKILKLGRGVRNVIIKPFRKRRRPSKLSPPPPELPPPPPSPPSEPTMPSPPPQKPTFPFLFPRTQSTVLPDPSRFFSPKLLSSPLPTNSFFQNFVLKNGDQPEYIHPYLIKSSSSALSLCYPSRFVNSAFIYQIFNQDLIISASQNTTDDTHNKHIISSFSDLGVTLDLPGDLQFFLVRGSPFLTCSVNSPTPLFISTIHAVLSLTPNRSFTKYTISLNNNQTWLCYTSTPIKLTQSNTSILTSDKFYGIIRFAILPDSGSRYEIILDQFSSSYPISGEAVFTHPFCLEYKWVKKGWGDLLMLAHPLHLKLLSVDNGDVAVLEEFKYRSMDGELVGVVGHSWVLKPDPVSVTWHSVHGINEEAFPEIVSALSKDVDNLNSSPITTNSSYFYGKAIARAARLALIAEEVCYLEVIPMIRKFLGDSIEPWLDGTFNGNGFLYDGEWRGIVTKQGSLDSAADFGFGIYNDHHYHLGYFLYTIAVLSKIDQAWGRKYKPQAYALMADFMTLSKRSNSQYTRLRNFDLWKLHSWAGGLTEFADGRNQESTSEAVNAYYSAALMGLHYGDTHLVATGSTLAAMEIQSAQTWWHVREEENMYEAEFSRENRVVGVLWANKRDSGLWFAPPDWKECRLGIQVLPLLPITEVLFSNVGFVKELVEWTLPALGREGVTEGWKGFVYSLEGIYDKNGALEKIRSLNGFDDGNSLSNLLWWIHSRGDWDEERLVRGGGKYCWFGHYCH